MLPGSQHCSGCSLKDRKENSLSVDNVKTDKVKPGYTLPKLYACPARSFSKGGGGNIKRPLEEDEGAVYAIRARQQNPGRKKC